MESTINLRRMSASDEFNKNPDLKKEDLTHLTEWLATQEHLPPVSEEMLILFHHSCYYQMADTKDCIETYYTMRTNCPEFFTNRDVNQPDLAKSLQTLKLTPLPIPLPKTGHQVMYHGLREHQAHKYVFVDAVKLTFMMFDAFAQEFGTTPGFVIVFDMQGTGLGHVFKAGLGALRKYITYLQEASPIRLKEIHMVNATSVLDHVKTLVKPFMKKELFNVIHVHRSGSESLFDHIPRECLPADLGGSLDTTDVYYGEHLKTLERMNEYFIADEKARVDETKREKKKKKSSVEKRAKETNLPVEKLSID